MLEASAPGNVFFFGEHVVVYERPAIVAAINRRTRSRITDRVDDNVTVTSEGYGVFNSSLAELKDLIFETHRDYKEVLDPVKDIIGSYLRDPDLSHGFDMIITSDIPKDSGGMGSSAAALSAVYGSLLKLSGKEPNPEEFFDALYLFQVKIHGGIASGSEIISSSIGGYNKVRIDKSGETPVLKRDSLGKYEFSLVIGDTGIKAHTKKAVNQVKEAWQRNNSEYERMFDDVASVVSEGEKAIRNNDPEKVGKLMSENHRILSKGLRVSHEYLERLITEALNAGAYGAKLSGGGMGGIMLSLVDDDTLEPVSRAIESIGGTVYKTRAGVDGIIENTI